MKIYKYTTVVFDCDGVVLDSNQIKTAAFRTAAQPYGEAAAEALVAHHVANGGISRYAKFAYFIDHILPNRAERKSGPDIEQMLETFAAEVRSGMEHCPVAEGLADLRKATPDARWLIVSGGDQAELREIFDQRRLAAFFDGGIFGSPDTKSKILAREIGQRNIRLPALFLGDSRHDHEAAKVSGLDFLFVHQWTEFQGWKDYCKTHDVNSIRQLANLLPNEIRVEHS